MLGRSLSLQVRQIQWPYPSLDQFHRRIMDLSKSYSWEAVLILALTFHKERVVMGLNDQEAWRMHPATIDDVRLVSFSPRLAIALAPIGILYTHSIAQ